MDPTGRSPRPELATLLATWQVIEPALLDLRKLHARALARAVARRCLERKPSRGALPRDLLERASEATWIDPALAFAHYVELQRDDLSLQTVDRIVTSLLDICSRPAPPPNFVGDSTPREWKSYCLRTFVEDYRRDGRASDLELAEPSASDVERLSAVREILGRSWPEMGAAVDALVREVVWFDRESGPSSGTAIQAYGAIFAARGQSLPRMLEVLVHETTHLEVIARSAVDKALARPHERAASPFRHRPRPLSRVLHAAMVAARDVEALDRSMDALPEKERDRAASLRRQCAESLGSALSSLEGAEWTPTGARLSEELRSHYVDISSRDRPIATARWPAAAAE